MAVLSLFSKRKIRASEKEVDVFIYDSVPLELRVQIVHIWQDAFGDRDAFMSITRDIYAEMHQALAREFGVFRLGQEYDDDFTAIANYFLRVQDNDRTLDIIEFTFQKIEKSWSNWNFTQYSSPKVTAEAAIRELNERFLQHSIGYEYVNGSLIQKDREILHREVTLPALVLLHEKKFAGANQEYLSAHEHYRRGKYKECLNDCLKSFESTMKVICNSKGWKFDQNATAKILIDVCLKNDLVPSFLQNEVNSLRSVLESGIPTVRNKLSGHGQGGSPMSVPPYYAAYLLHLTASTIVFLVEAAGRA